MHRKSFQLVERGNTVNSHLAAKVRVQTMRKIIIIALMAIVISGCPQVPPTNKVASAVSETLPTAGQNCVTVHRNPKQNEAEALSCTDSVAVIGPQHEAEQVTEVTAESDLATASVLRSLTVAVAETKNLVDAVSVKYSGHVIVSESLTTTDGFTCPKQAQASVIETDVTTDQLTCGN